MKLIFRFFITIIFYFWRINFLIKKYWNKSILLISNGREDRIWTCNPLVPNQVLYQVEPLPDIMVRSKGFEPLTFWFVAKHSIQLSYERICIKCQVRIYIKWWLQRESNQRHRDFQSLALPTELWSHIWRFQRGSNPRSSAWQADVLTSCTMEPCLN